MHICVWHSQSELAYLDLSYNNLTDFWDHARGVMALAETLKHHPFLAALDLSHNGLNNASLNALARALDVSAGRGLWLQPVDQQ